MVKKNEINLDPYLSMYKDQFQVIRRPTREIYNTFKTKQAYVFMTLEGRKHFSNMTEKTQIVRENI